MMEVSTTTIQNWENGTLPDKNFWKDIVGNLKPKKDEFIKLYGEAVMDHAPKKPEFKGILNMEMTESGKQLFKWYMKNIEK